MMINFQNFIYGQLSKRTFNSDGEKYLYFASIVTVAFSAIMHVFLLFFYLAVSVQFMFFYNIGSICLYLVCFLLINKKHYALSGLLLSGEVILYTLLCVFYIGAGSYVVLYLFITLMMQLIVPYAKMPVRIVVIGLLWAGILTAVFIGINYPPLYALSESARLVHMLFNINMAVIGVIAELLVGNIINNYIAQFNKMQVEKFQTEANIDPLTGLYNRRYAELFFGEINREESAQGWCVAMLDIDDFKKVNDINGHAAGDEVLVTVANTIKNSLRKTDVVFRWGGEEFLLLLRDVDLGGALPILDKMRRTLAEEEMLGRGKTLHITVTIGVARLRKGHIDESIDESDKKMYAGKQQGKNIVVI